MSTPATPSDVCGDVVSGVVNARDLVCELPAGHSGPHRQDGTTWTPSAPRRRTPSERTAYVDGFAAGAEAALREVARLNFSEVANRARDTVAVSLRLIQESDA
jgi:hypothetical protein